MTSRGHRRHAVRVAAVATLVVMVFYVIAAIVLNLIVTNHLITTTDNRLADRLEDARQQTLALHGSSAPNDDTDLDDAPVFLWSIAPSGHGDRLELDGAASAVTPLGTGPGHARHRQLGLPVRHAAGARCRAGGRPEHGLDIRTSSRRSLVAELVFGVILAVAVFAGATVVGLRASAPSELVRRRQAEFTADASHELRTPISVIEAEVGLALDRPRDPAAYREVLERVGRESTRLRRIVEDLLWLARADSEQARARRRRMADVGEVVERCVERFGALAASHGVDLSMQRVGNGPFIVQAQPDLIDRLAGVLIDNACKFAGEGGPGRGQRRATGAPGWISASTTPAPGSPKIDGRGVRPVPPGHRTMWRAPASVWPSPTRWSAPRRASGRSGLPNWEAHAWRSPGEKCRGAKASPTQTGEALSESLA